MLTPSARRTKKHGFIFLLSVAIGVVGFSLTANAFVKESTLLYDPPFRHFGDCVSAEEHFSENRLPLHLSRHSHEPALGTVPLDGKSPLGRAMFGLTNAPSPAAVIQERQAGAFPGTSIDPASYDELLPLEFNARLLRGMNMYAALLKGITPGLSEEDAKRNVLADFRRHGILGGIVLPVIEMMNMSFSALKEEDARTFASFANDVLLEMYPDLAFTLCDGLQLADPTRLRVSEPYSDAEQEFARRLAGDPFHDLVAEQSELIWNAFVELTDRIDTRIDQEDWEEMEVESLAGERMSIPRSIWLAAGQYTVLYGGFMTRIDENLVNEGDWNADGTQRYHDSAWRPLNQEEYGVEIDVNEGDWNPDGTPRYIDPGAIDYIARSPGFGPSKYARLTAGKGPLDAKPFPKSDVVRKPPGMAEVASGGTQEPTTGEKEPTTGEKVVSTAKEMWDATTNKEMWAATVDKKMWSSVVDRKMWTETEEARDVVVCVSKCTAKTIGAFAKPGSLLTIKGAYDCTTCFTKSLGLEKEQPGASGSPEDPKETGPQPGAKRTTLPPDPMDRPIEISREELLGEMEDLLFPFGRDGRAPGGLPKPGAVPGDLPNAEPIPGELPIR